MFGETMPTPDEAMATFATMVEGADETGALPVLMYGTKDDKPILMLLAGGPGGMQMMLRGACLRATQEYGRPKWLVLLAESYRAPVKDLSVHLAPGELQRRATAGEEIEECVLAYGVSSEEEWGQFAVFTRKDGVVTWGEVVNQPQDAVGGVPSIMREAVRG